MEKKKIILVVPYHFGLPNRFKQNLEFLGFEVFLYPKPMKVKIPLKDKIIHGYKKFFLKDRTHKSKIRASLEEKQYFDFIESLPVCDYALIIRPDLISENTIKSIKNKCHYMVAYQWDGMSRYPIDKRIVNFFDDFFVFDERDLNDYPQCHFLTNFYFDDLSNEKIIVENDIFFVGTYMNDRIEQILSLSLFFKENGYSTDFHLANPNKKSVNFDSYHIQTSCDGFSFTENIKRLQKAKVLLDFRNEAHYGLSFRTFEAIGYKKKLITNNELVKKYDFYNPNNIFVFKDCNFEGLKDFLDTPYENLPKEIYEKYSFTSWIKHIFKRHINFHKTEQQKF